MGLLSSLHYGFTPYMGVLKKKNIQGFKKLKKCIYLQKVSCINWIRYNSCCNYSWCLLFIKGSRHILLIYSGIFSLLALIALGVVGFYLQKMNKKEKFMMYRKVHQIIVIIFGIGLFIHLIV